ncbi:alpha/beta hydrolase [Thalassotalea sp. PS06]|uniref:alpha/beta hydrolase n=1 Tax=Thalassotalea sp. PS06 TaxID=2594005 RepID=UPI001161FB73|nr:alpha/beta hydrolase [Thalassotalea sp. PS06]QDP01003.1 alpha/beta hydrolase [Thalassotalea sp. PS06]
MWRIIWFSCLLYCSPMSAVELHKLADNSQGLSRYLLEFEHQGLHQYGLLIIGSEQGLENRDLVLLAHGFHPNPPMYGKTSPEISKRPGDYYRQWVEAYGLAGFNVLVPDYRGHNDSEGFEFTHQAGKYDFPERYYASDLIAAVSAFENYRGESLDNIVIAGHSMGAPIAFYAGNQLADKVRLVSLWSSASYRFEQDKTTVTEVPFIIHHGVQDKTTPIQNSEYYRQQFPELELYYGAYQSDKHMLSGKDFNDAMAIDIGYIKRFFKENK